MMGKERKGKKQKIPPTGKRVPVLPTINSFFPSLFPDFYVAPCMHFTSNESIRRLWPSRHRSSFTRTKGMTRRERYQRIQRIHQSLIFFFLPFSSFSVPVYVIDLRPLHLLGFVGNNTGRPPPFPKGMVVIPYQQGGVYSALITASYTETWSICMCVCETYILKYFTHQSTCLGTLHTGLCVLGTYLR